MMRFKVWVYWIDFVLLKAVDDTKGLISTADYMMKFKGILK